MIELMREVQTKFQEINALLHSTAAQDQNYFSNLSEATQQAYVLMNEGMCESTTVCHECAKHRDLLQNVIPVLEDLQEGKSLSDAYAKSLDNYRIMTNDVLTRISTILSAV